MADDLTPTNFIQRIKEMDKADRNKIKLKDLIDIIMQAPTTTPPPPNNNMEVLAQLQTDMALLAANMATIRNVAVQNQEEIKGLKAANDQLTADNTSLKEEVKVLREKGLAADPKVVEQVAELRNSVNSIEQYLRINNLEIVGLPEANDGETEEALLLNAINSLQGLEEVRADDIDISHPMASKRKDNKNVHVVKFISRKTKARVLAAKKSEPNRLFKFRNNDVFINEHLSPSNRSLFAAATGKKKDLGYKFLWTRSGTIFMRKTEDSEVITISHENDLANLV